VAATGHPASPAAVSGIKGWFIKIIGDHLSGSELIGVLATPVFFY
jgi:hypothetical protein